VCCFWFLGWTYYGIGSRVLYQQCVQPPIQEDFDSCLTGAATNAIFRPAMGYKSVIIPILAMAINIFARFSFVTKYGIVVAAPPLPLG